MKDNKRIKRLANKIAHLEKELKNKNNSEQVLDEMNQLADSLSLEDLFLIDEYIMAHKLLN